MAIKINQELFAVPTNKAIYESMMCLREMPFEHTTKRLLSILDDTKLSEDFLLRWLQTDDLKQAIMTVKDLQRQHLIKGMRTLSDIPKVASEEALNSCLSLLCEEASMLANDQGFHLANVGFDKEQADELAAVAAELHAFHCKRVQNLVSYGLVKSDVWSLHSEQVSSKMSFWPMHTDQQNFILITKGHIRSDNDGLLNLARILMKKYNQ